MAMISIIIPVYQVEKYLDRCICSVLNQTIEDFELLLVDDGSKDQSGLICDDYALKDNRILVFHTENKGQSCARNLAIDWVMKNSESSFITFIDSDDWIHPQYLEMLKDSLTKYDADISQCLHIEIDSEIENEVAIINDSCLTPKEQFLNWYSAYMWGKMYRRNIFNNIRFPEGKVFEDVAIWYQILFRQKKIALVKNVLYYYYKNPDSTVRSPWKPDKLNQVYAWEEQLKFFRQYGDSELYENALYRYFSVMINHIEYIRVSPLDISEKLMYTVQLRQKIRKAYHHLPCDEYVEKNKLWYFAQAYPILNWLYWIYRGIKKKILSKREK